MNNAASRPQESMDYQAKKRYVASPEKVEQLFGGFKLSNIDNTSKNILENLTKFSQTRDENGNNAVLIEAGSNSTIEYNGKQIPSLLLDGTTTSLKLLYSTKSVPPAHTFEVTSQRGGQVETDRFVVKAKAGANNSNDLDALLRSVGIDINESAPEAIQIPKEMNRFVKSVEVVNGETMIQFELGTRMKTKASTDGKEPAVSETNVEFKKIKINNNTAGIQYIGFDKTPEPRWHHFKVINKDGTHQEVSFKNAGMTFHELPYRK